MPASGLRPERGRRILSGWVRGSPAGTAARATRNRRDEMPMALELMDDPPKQHPHYPSREGHCRAPADVERVLILRVCRARSYMKSPSTDKYRSPVSWHKVRLGGRSGGSGFF